MYRPYCYKERGFVPLSPCHWLSHKMATLSDTSTRHTKRETWVMANQGIQLNHLNRPSSPILKRPFLMQKMSLKCRLRWKARRTKSHWATRSTKSGLKWKLTLMVALLISTFLETLDYTGQWFWFASRERELMVTVHSVVATAQSHIAVRLLFHLSGSTVIRFLKLLSG